MTAPEPARSTATILMVESDEGVREEMAAYLTGQGYAVVAVSGVAEAGRIFASVLIHLLVVGIDEAGDDASLALCRAVADTHGAPILALSGAGDSTDRILGLELGVDHYVAKPIAPRELLARVKALLRHRAGAPPRGHGRYGFAGFHLDPRARTLRTPTGRVLALTPSEAAILTALAENPQAAVTREDLARLVQGEGADAAGRGIDLHISRLRRKMDPEESGAVIRTYRGFGYLLDAEVTAE